MISLRSISDVEKARLPPHLLPTVTRYLRALLSTYNRYDPESHGYLILVTPTDTDTILGERLGRRWGQSMFEGASYDPVTRCFSTLILRNNEYGISILIPDEPWLDPAIRARILREANEETQNAQAAPTSPVGAASFQGGKPHADPN